MARALPVFDKFDINGDSKTSLGPRWTKNVQKLENLIVAMNVTGMSVICVTPKPNPKWICRVENEIPS